MDPPALGYAELTPQQVLDALDAVGLHGDGRILQLNSYENRVVQAMLDDGRAVVAKFYRPGRWSDAQIVEEHRFAAELAAAEVPVVAPLELQRDPAAGDALQLVPADAPTLARLATAHGTLRYAVAPRCAGRAPELEDPQTLERIGRFIGRLHAVGARRRFEHRVTLDPAADGARARTLLLDGGFLPPELAPAWADASARALDALVAAFDRAGALRTLRLHGDCHVGNVLWREEGEGAGPRIVDLDDACNGPAAQDLWMLVSGDAASMQRQLATLLDGYRVFMDFDERERTLFEPLRTLRMLRYSAWLAERWSDPAFPAAFPFFGTAAYWSQQTAQLREQLEAIADGG